MTSTQRAQPKPPRERRTQQERSAATKRLLLDATVNCLAKKGYASTSISEILKEVNVSRGALLHHFPSKTELVAAAMNNFYSNLDTEVTTLLEQIKPEDDSLRKRLDIVNEVFGKNSSARIEFMVATRTDPELARAAQQEHTTIHDFYPQLTELADSETVAWMISAFLLGNGLMSAWDASSTSAAYETFVKMIENFVAIPVAQD